MELWRKLEAIEDIRRLKALYFRYVDTKDWRSLEHVFAEDVEFDRTTGNSVQDPWTMEWIPPLPQSSQIVRGRTAVVEMIKNAVAAISSVHHGHNPEIDILDMKNAKALWPMTDTLRDRSGRLILRGAGYYHETYENLSSGWVIKTARLSRLSLEYGEAHASQRQ